MTKTQIHHIILLDQSGSMLTVVEQTRTGFNEIIQQIKKDAETYEETQEHLASLVVFNGEVDRVYWLEDIANLTELNEGQFKPGGSTALNDAIGLTVAGLEKDLKLEIAKGDAKIFMTVITDGYDNSSREYGSAELKKVVEGLKQDDDNSPWTLSLIGANIDSLTTGQNLGFKAGMTNSFDATAVGTQDAFAGMTNTRATYSQGISQGYSKTHVDALVSHVSAEGKQLSQDEMNEFVDKLMDKSKTDD